MTTSKPARVALYARVSRANRNGQTVSVDDQIAELRDLVAAHDGLIVAEHLDRAIRASRTAKARPGWEALLADIAADRVDLVALWETSRSSRRLAEWATFRDLCIRHRVQWLTPDGGIERPKRGDLGQILKAGQSEGEVEQTSARIRRTVRANAAAGQPHGKERYGLARRYDPRTAALVEVEIEPEEADVIRWLAEAVLAGRSLRSLAATLNDRGTLAPIDAIAARRGRETTGAKWSPRTVRELLSSPALAGVRVHEERDEYGRLIGRAEHAADWPTILDLDTHTRLLALFADPTRRSSQSTRVRHFLSGILVCDRCGGKMRAQDHHHANGWAPRLTYTCERRDVVVNRPRVEAMVTEVILARLAEPDAVVAPEADGSEAEARVLEGRLQEAREAYKGGRISLASFSDFEADLTAGIKALQAKQRAALGLPEWAVGPEQWDEWSPAQRKIVAGALFDRILVRPAGRGARAVPWSRLGFVPAGTTEPAWGDDTPD